MFNKYPEKRIDRRSKLQTDRSHVRNAGQDPGILRGKIKKNDTEPLDAVYTLNDLKLHQYDINTIAQNDSFKTLCDVVGADCPKYSTSVLLNSLSTVLSMNLPPNLYIVQSLQTEVIWRMRRMTYKQLIFVLRFHLNQQRSNLESSVVKNVIEIIERRWVEIESLKEAAALFVMMGNFSKDFVGKLENRSMELMETSGSDDISKLFASLSEIKHRPVPLLRSMAFYLMKQKEKLSVKQATSVLCAMNSLRFPDSALLGRLSNDLVLEIDQVEKASVIGAILTNLGQIRWKHAGLMKCLTEWIVKNMDKCQPQHLTSYLITAANLNYSPTDVSIFDKISAKLTEKSVTVPEVWLDVVYSLVIKNKAKPFHLVSVLKPEFSKAITSPHTKIKLATVRSFSKFEHPNYKHPLTSINDLTVVKPKEVTLNNSAVLATLQNFIPTDRFMKCNKIALDCIPIEAEFIVDSNGKSLPIADYKEILDKNSPLPHGTFKVALLVRHFRDYLMNSQELTGGNALSNKLLEKLNYRVIEVPYSEFVAASTTLKKVQYLKSLITTSIFNK
uniref:RAP domain-containing protein n=1 Tax=Strigamia maritima TaxID=126957 RepID=T1JF43_STRMM